MRSTPERTSGTAGLALESLCFLVLLALFGAATLTLPFSPVRVSVVLLGLLLLPGYALSTLAFPERPATRPTEVRRLGQTEAEWRRGALTGAQRLAVSFGLSVATLPILGVALATSPLSLGLRTAFGTIAVLSVLTFALGLVRRMRTAEASRYVLPIRSLYRSVGRGLSANPLDAGLNVALVLVLVVASAGFLGAVAAPQDQTSFTTASLLTENGQGQLVADGYKTNFTTGESGIYVLEVVNHEDEQVTYTVVVEQQRVDQNGNVVRSTELNQYQRAIGPNDTWRLRHSLQPAFAGNNLRFTYLIYRGEAPEDPSVDSAYRHLTLDINVRG